MKTTLAGLLVCRLSTEKVFSAPAPLTRHCCSNARLSRAVGELGDAGVGYQVIDGADGRGTRSQGVQVPFAGDVARQPVQTLAGVGVQAFRRSFAPCHRQDSRAVPEQRFGQFQADAGTRAGDDGEPVVEFTRWESLVG